MLLDYKGKSPDIRKGVYIAPTAVVIGDVTIEENSSIWFNAVVRGDLAPIHIGKATNVQDNCTLHTDAGVSLTIGDHVTIGHNAIIHGCTLHSHVLVGMGAVILNHAVVHKGSVVAANALVKEGHIIGPHALVAGVPAVEKKRLGAQSIIDNDGFAEEYVELCEIYLESVT
jgi:carbonic anhydrase/acetyltransferase-like protein (isoleucine patch superfamily)